LGAWQSESFSTNHIGKTIIVTTRAPAGQPDEILAAAAELAARIVSECSIL